MFKYHNNPLPCYFDTFFNLLSDIHSYNTISEAKQSYYLSKSRTNYGIFNICFQGPKQFGIQLLKILSQLSSIDLRRI